MLKAEVMKKMNFDRMNEIKAWMEKSASIPYPVILSFRSGSVKPTWERLNAEG
jgi:hypothetical protein